MAENKRNTVPPGTSLANIAYSLLDEMDALTDDLDHVLHPRFHDDERTDPGVRLERELAHLGDVTMPQLRVIGDD